MSKLRPEYLSLIGMLLLAAGIWTGDHLACPTRFLGLAFFLFLALFFWQIWRWSRQKKGLLLGLFCLGTLLFLGGILRLNQAAQTYEALPHHLAGAKLQIEGRLSEKRGSYLTPAGKVGRYFLTLDRWSYLDEANWRPGQGQVALFLPEKGYLVGEKLRLRGASQPLHYYKNPGQYDSQHRDRGKEVFLRFFVQAEKDIERLAPPAFWQRQLAFLREELTASYLTVLGKNEAAVLSSLLFGGHYEELPPQLLADFSTTGLIHILSVSGSHVALLLAVMQLLGRALGLRERGILVLSAIFLLGYTALAEFTAPVIRAACMGLCSALSLQARRDYTAGHALALVMSGMLLYQPYLFFDLSFRLSCGAAAGIILFQAPLQRLFSFLPLFLRAGLVICLAAQLLVLPLLLQAFFSLPTYTLLANLLVAPVLDFVLVLGLGASFLTLFFTAGAQLILQLIKPLLLLSLKGNAFLAALPGSRLWLGALNPWLFAAWYSGLVAVFSKKWRLFFLPVCCILLALGFWLQQNSRPQVFLPDAGKDQVTCFLEGDGKATIWYNKSKYASPEQAAVVVTPALRALGIFHLRALHVSGEAAARTRAIFLENFVVDQVAASAPEKTVPGYAIFTRRPAAFPTGGIVEMRSLTDWDGRSFPVAAAAVVAYPCTAYDEAFTEWQELAAYYEVPCFSPSKDGALSFSRKKGAWQIRMWRD